MVGCVFTTIPVPFPATTVQRVRNQWYWKVVGFLCGRVCREAGLVSVNKNILPDVDVLVMCTDFPACLSSEAPIPKRHYIGVSHPRIL